MMNLVILWMILSSMMGLLNTIKNLNIGLKLDIPLLRMEHTISISVVGGKMLMGLLANLMPGPSVTAMLALYLFTPMILKLR